MYGAQVCGVNISRGKFSYGPKILRTRRARPKACSISKYFRLS